MRNADGQRYCHKMPGVREVAAEYRCTGDHDRKSLRSKTGYGSISGSLFDGKGADQTLAGNGKRKTLRNGQPGGFGTQGGEHYGSGGRFDRDQQQFVQQSVRKECQLKTTKKNVEICKIVLDKCRITW